MVKLGDLKRVGLREIWADEAREFTPWLIEEQNLQKLNEVIGMDLEIEGHQVPVGPYWADILARDTSTDKFVVIENQLTKTDHDHLGKLLTYASVLDAATVIWIASEFSEEHKKALDWLNDHSTEDVTFIGIQVEVLQIDKSIPAVNFNLVSDATDIVKQANKYQYDAIDSEARELQLEFWKLFRQKLIDSKYFPSVQEARPRYWYNMSLGRSKIHLVNRINTFDNKIGVSVYMRNMIADVALTNLLKDKDAIEKEIGAKLLWNPHPDKKDKVIALYLDTKIEDKTKWDEYLNWMLEKTVKFHQAFSRRVKNIDFEIDENIGEDSTQ